MHDGQHNWDTRYEWKAVTLLSLGVGLVGLDRWIVAPLLPAMMKDLNLTAQDAGNIIGILGLAWGFFAVIMGGLSDRIGRRKVLIPAIIGFSVLSGFSGFASGIMSLLAIRAIMGVMEGSFCPTSFATTNDASHPKRRGFNLGLQQCLFGLFGLAFAPIVATQLLNYMSWRHIFVLVAVPGLVLGALMYFVIRETPAASTTSAGGHQIVVPKGRWKEIFNRNIIVAMVGLFCAMAAIYVLGGMLPMYLIGFLKLTPQQMGFVMSALGFGGFAGQISLLALSDVIGRRPVAILGFASAAVMMYLFQHTGANTTVLFMSLFVVSFFALGMFALLTGPISTEAAPAGLISSTIGIVVGAGEIFGGGVVPSIAGAVATRYGIENILWLPLGAAALGIVACLFLKETAPRKVSVMQSEPLQQALAES